VWFPYLARRLRALAHEVQVPQLPNSDVGLESWREMLAATVASGAAADTVLVGHSIGGVNLLRLLERHNVATDGAFAGVVLVSTQSHEVGYDAVKEFFATPFDFPRIRRAATTFRVLAAVDDPVNVPDPIEHVRTLVTGLGATALLTPTGGHFGTSPDEHIELPEVVDLTLECLARHG